MKISEMIDRLEKIKAEHSDIDVMFNDTDSHGPYSASSVRVAVAEKDDFPEDWDMPEGFTFVDIGSW